MTIGYGAPTNDIFYGGCSSMALLLTVESVSGIFLDSLCFGVFFVRFSRATLVEAHVRCYSVAKRHSDAPFQTLPMRIQSPDDNLGAFVLLALPQLIVHRIDPSSPLFPPPASSSSTSSVTQCEIAHHVAQSDLELVVVLEGTDATSGNTMQARYSYTADDIKWHHTFAPCVSRDPVTHGAVVDFDLFHTLVPAPPCPSTVV
ncbi:hypothetical protein DYB25_013254 [Aphanomyces astaci]|uniref:Inward rectifier potassium channel C-terminal domain-containing protein n=1 Tax=Aphanomyces astaci TaxID=112090 RepID=A0A397BGD0_APHAT|nr:hypothetical protein DYB25_013254 [Aphanomyces astaci]